MGISDITCGVWKDCSVISGLTVSLGWPRARALAVGRSCLVTGLTAGMFVRFVTAFTVILWRRIVSVAHKKHTLSMRCQQFYVTVQKFVRLSPELRTHDSSGGRRRQMCR